MGGGELRQDARAVYTGRGGCQIGGGDTDSHTILDIGAGATLGLSPCGISSRSQQPNANASASCNHLIAWFVIIVNSIIYTINSVAATSSGAQLAVVAALRWPRYEG